jgi:hypothetical protein
MGISGMPRANAVPTMAVEQYHNVRQSARLVPESRRIAIFIGMTPTHVWTAGASGPNMPIDAIHRFQVEP